MVVILSISEEGSPTYSGKHKTLFDISSETGQDICLGIKGSVLRDG